ncbi:MAG: O-antigen ligase family protein [Chitinophagaceae bacterium]|nr:O-antigen ligase family protein [Chitinophagaceae bacterium]
MPHQLKTIVQQLSRWKSFHHPFLWLSAAGIAVTMIWLPLINAMLCILFFLLWAYYQRFRFTITDKPHFFLFISVYLITAISFFYSHNKSEALRILQLKLPLLIFPLVFASGLDWTKEQIRLLLILFSLSVGVFCIVTISNAVTITLSSGNAQDLFGYSILPFKYVYASVASLFCVFGTVIHLNEMAEKRKILTSHLIPLLLFWITLTLLSNRMAITLCVIITLFFLMHIIRSAVAKMIAVVFVLLILTGLYFWNQTFREKVQVITQFNSGTTIRLDKDASLGRTWDGLQLRLAIWNCATGIIKQHFLAGVGVGDAQQTLQTTYEERKFYFASRYNTYNAHNQFMEQWLMTGIAGFILFLLSLIIPLFRCLKSGRLLYSLFLIVFICFCLTESFLEVSKGVVWFSFFNSMFAFQRSHI